ncbi:MAG: uracil-DNA glycosylase family protein [Pikeienuella sp.]
MSPGDASDARLAALALLAWQSELGADEALGEQPVDRFALAAPASPVPRPRETGQPAATATSIAAVAPNPAAVAPAAAVAGSAKSLAELATAIAAWDGSDLRQGARSCVFADGLPGARVMVIGEAPGSEEDRRGLPFVGRAGQLLDRMLAAIGLDRSAKNPAGAVYITNILPWRPPGNRTPSEAEARAFLPFVERHIALAQPEVILALGNTPTKALLDTGEGIRRMRGRWRRHSASGLPLLPSFHPAYLLRQPAEKAQAWVDLVSLRQVLDGADPGV